MALKKAKQTRYKPPMFRRLREQTGLSIRQVALAAAIDRTKISRWERGQSVRMIREAINVGKVLGLTVEQLFADDPDNR
jgi:transcriptional regulator with XRE-family HTH domain